MRLALRFLLLAAGLAATGALAGGRAWILLWPALCSAVVGAGYLGLGGRVLGKREDGTLSVPVALFMLPYLAVAWSVWHVLRRVTGVAPWARVAPRITIGRRLYAHELPPDVSLVVDLTAELPEPAAVRAGRAYLAMPTLDGGAPAPDELERAVDRVVAWDGEVFVHCAAGHGRSACLVAAVLIRRGLARDAAEAERLLREVRPTVSLGRQQRTAAERAGRAALVHD